MNTDIWRLLRRGRGVWLTASALAGAAAIAGSLCAARGGWPVVAVLGGIGSGLLAGVAICRRGAQRATEAGDRSSGGQRTPADTGASARSLFDEEIRPCLDALSGVADRLPELHNGHREIASGAIRDAVGRLTRRLDENLPAAAGTRRKAGAELTSMLEEVLETQRVLMESLGIHVRVRLGHCSERIAAPRAGFRDALGDLLRATARCCPPDGEIVVRTREVAGLLGVELRTAQCAQEPAQECDIPPLEGHRAWLESRGGELWAIEEDGIGYGLALPLRKRWFRTRRRRRGVPAGPAAGAAA